MSDAAKPGRPLRGSGETKLVTIRATYEERAAWTAAAGDSSLSEWIRARLNAAAKRR